MSNSQCHSLYKGSLKTMRSVPFILNLFNWSLTNNNLILRFEADFLYKRKPIKKLKTFWTPQKTSKKEKELMYKKVNVWNYHFLFIWNETCKPWKNYTCKVYCVKWRDLLRKSGVWTGVWSHDQWFTLTEEGGLYSDYRGSVITR